jgi:hypothetical protein
MAKKKVIVSSETPLRLMIEQCLFRQYSRYDYERARHEGLTACFDCNRIVHVLYSESVYFKA